MGTYSDEPKAQAQALIRAGHSPTQVSEQLGIPERTVFHWQKRWRDIAAEQEDRELLDDDYRIIKRSTELIHDAYDVLEAGPPSDLLKHLFPINAIRGTAADKVLARQKLAALSQPQQVNIWALVQGRALSIQEPVTIEAQGTQIPSQHS